MRRRCKLLFLFLLFEVNNPHSATRSHTWQELGVDHMALAVNAIRIGHSALTETRTIL